MCPSTSPQRSSIIPASNTPGAHNTYVLVDEQNSNVLALGGEAVECSFDGRGLGLCVYNEKVLLAVRRLGNML
jgi:hypothetical protein